MSIAIITEGSQHIGFGHITRCLSIYQAFRQRGLMPRFIVHGDETVKPLFEGIPVEIINWRDQQENLFSAISGYDLAVVDSYLADLAFYQALSGVVRLGVYIDDTLRLSYPRGVVVNFSISAETLPYPTQEGVDYLLGCRYFPLRQPFWEIPPKKIRPNLQNVLITFGGDDIRQLTPIILAQLSRTWPSLQKQIAIGGGFQNTAEIKAAGDRNTHFHYQLTAAQMKTLMLDADAAISASGQTLYELARVGVPTIAVGVADNQKYNIAGFQKTGSVRYAGWWHSSELTTHVLQLLKELEPESVRAAMAVHAQQLVTGCGAHALVLALMARMYR